MGVSVSGNDLTKTGAAGSWNAGASSFETLESHGFVEFKATGSVTLGLNKGDTGVGYTEIDFGIQIWSGTLYIYESGGSPASFGAVTPTDLFRVEVADGVVRYRKNGAILYTSTKSAGFPLLVDASLYSTGSTLTDVRIGQTSYAAEAGTTVSAGTLTKTGTTGWNAGAIAIRRIHWGDGFVEFSATESNKLRAAGLSNGDTDKTAADIDFAILLRSDATVEIQEGGASRGTFGAYSGGDRFRVELEGGTVTYLRNGSVLYTSAVAPVYPLWGDTALYDTGATLEDLVVSEILWTATGGLSIDAGTLLKTGTSGWNAGAATGATITSGDGFVEFTASETNTTRACGLADQDTSYDPAEIDFAIQLQDNGEVRVYESGTLRGSFGSYVPGDRFRVEVQMAQVVYRKDGVVFYSSTLDPSYPLSVDVALDTPGATLREVRFGRLVWKNAVGVAVWGQGLVNTAASGYGNSGAVSTVELASGDGGVEFTARETWAIRAAGLSKGDSNRSYTDIDFGLEASNGNVAIYQKGSWVGNFGTYVNGDRFRVAVEGGVVKYRKNGALLYTSSQAIEYPLLVDTALNTSGAAIPEVVLTGPFAASSLVVTPPGFSSGTGTYNTPQNVTVSCSQTATTVRYTTNGVDPTQTDPVVACGGVVVVNQSLTLKAKGWKSGWAPSAVTSAVYTMVVGAPSLSPPPASYVGVQTITLSTVTPGTTIRYTTNGVDPSGTDPAGTSVVVDHTLVLKARATRAGWTDSAVTAGTYVLSMGTLATPSLSPVGGSYSAPQTVAISCATAGATIRYTTDGTDPSFVSPAYSQPFTVSGSRTVKARAFKPDWQQSAVGAASYVIGNGTAADAPILSVPSGRYANGLRVVVTSPLAGTTIRYTTTGIDPTESDATIASGGTLLIERPVRLKAKAWKSGLTASQVASADYDIVGAVAAGMYHSLVLRADGTVASFGRNLYGSLGDNTNTLRTAPVNVVGLDDVVAVTAGESHSVALKADGTVWSWGWNSDGILGAGIADTQKWTPVQVVVNGGGALTGVVAIAAGGRHTLALKADGTVWAWGFGYYGSLGLGSTANQNRATLVPGLAGVTAIAAGGGQSLALGTNGGTHGYLWGWGLNDKGQLADGTTVNKYSPYLIAEQVAYAAAGPYGTFIRKADGSSWGSGLNDTGQLGLGATQSPKLSFVPVLSGLTGVSKVAASGAHTLALTGVGEVWATGYNGLGSVGDGTTVNRTTPVNVVLLDDVVDIAAARYAHDPWNPSSPHSMALTSDGRVWTWGSHAYGALGSGTTTTTHRYRPQPIADLSTADQTWPLGDADGDDLLNRDEVALGTDPFNADTNADGISDSVAISSGVSATNMDVDGDGIMNATERSLGTDPHRADTDGDGASDAVDCFAWDPTRSTCPQPQPGDLTAPLINLFEPVGAVLLSSLP